jgi:hypothetical protein
MSCDVGYFEPMKTFSLQLLKMYRPRVQQTIELLQASPVIALLLMGAIVALTGDLLMALLVAVLR